MHDLAGDHLHSGTLAMLQKRLREVWGDPEEIERVVLASQAAREVIAGAASAGFVASL